MPALSLCLAGSRPATGPRLLPARGGQRAGPRLVVSAASCSPPIPRPHQRRAAQWLAGAAAAAAVLGGSAAAAPPALANNSGERVGEFYARGLIFKDDVQLTAIEDPKVEGVVVYVSDFKRNTLDRLSKDYFNEPSQASLTCTQYAPIVVNGDLGKKKCAQHPESRERGEGEDVFAASKNLFQNKTLRVHRSIDEKRNMLIYTSYSTGFIDEDTISSRFRTSLCAIPLPPGALAPPPAAE